MNPTLVLWKGMEPKAGAMAREAASLAFSAPTIREIDSVRDAWQRNSPSTGPELLVLTDPALPDLHKMIEATEHRRLHCPVVVLGKGSAAEGIEVVGPEEWSAPLVGRVFGAALAQYDLRRENERLRGDLRSIGRRITHDLRTPLGGILSNVEVLKETLLTEAPSRTALTQPIYESAEAMAKIIEQMSLLMRASADPREKQEIGMGAVVWAALQRLESKTLLKRGSLTQPSAWPEVMGVASWLEAIWWNLVANALQHSGAEPRIEVGWRREDNEYRFWVQDHGLGVPAAKRSTLFQPFHCLYQTNAAAGLGLSIVQRLVELQQGRCGYEPLPEGGSCFFFTLPVKAKRHLK